jgi:hypothetical protein
MGQSMITETLPIAAFTLYQKLEFRWSDGTSEKTMHRHLVFKVWDAPHGSSVMCNMSVHYFCDGVETELWNFGGETYTPQKRFTIDHCRYMWNHFVSKGWTQVQSVTTTS